MKILKILGGIIVLLIAGVGIMVATKKPAMRPAPDWKVESTPELVERGKYLANVTMGCLDCHTERDFNRFGSPPKEGAELGAGGDCFDESYGMPGTVCVSNITPDKEAGIGSWTDGEIARAIREGVDKDGMTLFPMMPYGIYKKVSDDDIRAIIAYLKTLPPSKKVVPATQIKFPVSFFIKMAPKPLSGPVPHPDVDDKDAYGNYLTMGCRYCHTPTDNRKVPIPGRDFSGGQEFKTPAGSFYSANLTKHSTGYTKTKEEFIGQFKSFTNTASVAVEVEPKDNTMMPWLATSHTTEEELGIIYDFIQKQPPLENTVVKFVPKAN